MVEERQIERGADHELLILREDDVTTVVAVVDGLQDIRRIIGAITIGLNNACLRPIR